MSSKCLLRNYHKSVPPPLSVEAVTISPETISTSFLIEQLGFILAKINFVAFYYQDLIETNEITVCTCIDRPIKHDYILSFCNWLIYFCGPKTSENGWICRLSTTLCFTVCPMALIPNGINWMVRLYYNSILLFTMENTQHSKAHEVYSRVCLDLVFLIDPFVWALVSNL